jgi:hypothetical protein
MWISPIFLKNKDDPTKALQDIASLIYDNPKNMTFFTDDKGNLNERVLFATVNGRPIYNYQKVADPDRIMDQVCAKTVDVMYM